MVSILPCLLDLFQAAQSHAPGLICCVLEGKAPQPVLSLHLDFFYAVVDDDTFHPKQAFNKAIASLSHRWPCSLICFLNLGQFVGAAKLCIVSLGTSMLQGKTFDEGLDTLVQVRIPRWNDIPEKLLCEDGQRFFDYRLTFCGGIELYHSCALRRLRREVIVLEQLTDDRRRDICLIKSKLVLLLCISLEHML